MFIYTFMYMSVCIAWTWVHVDAWGCLSCLWMHLPTEDRSIRSPRAAVIGSCKLCEDMGTRKQTLQEQQVRSTTGPFSSFWKIIFKIQSYIETFIIFISLIKYQTKCSFWLLVQWKALKVWEGEVSGHITSTVSKQSNECWYFVHSLLFTQPTTPAPWVMLTLRAGITGHATELGLRVSGIKLRAYSTLGIHSTSGAALPPHASYFCCCTLVSYMMKIPMESWKSGE